MTVFEDELNDMTQAAIPAVKDAFDLDRVTTEFGYGPGRQYRTDIAGVSWDVDALRTRADRLDRWNDDGQARYQPIARLNVKPYLMMRRLADDSGELTRHDWKDGSGWSTAWKRPWREFAAKGLLRKDPAETDDFGFITRRARLVDVPIVGDQWAIELKPRDWQRALEQASRAFDGVPRYPERPTGFEDMDVHWGYANFAVVVMDADHIDAVDPGPFEDLGVGLAGLDRDDLGVVVPPRRHDPDDYTKPRLHLNETTLPAGWVKPE